jgi:hypothetical protein
MTPENFVRFKLYVASRDFRYIPNRLTVREYLESRTRELFGFDLASITDRVSSWLSAISNLSVEGYSVLPRTWHDGQINIIGPEDVPHLSILDQISFRLVGVHNYRHPIEVRRFIDRMENLIFRKRFDLFDDMTDAELKESKELMSCAGFTDSMRIHEMAAYMARVRLVSLGTFIKNADCIWDYMKKPYRMRISSDYRRPQTTTTSPRPAANSNSTWKCIKKSICWFFSRAP